MVTFVRALRALFPLLTPHRKWRWLLLVVLAVAVTGLEAVGAILIFALVGLISTDPSADSLPSLGPLDRFMTGHTLLSVQIVVACLVVAFFLVRLFVVVGQRYVEARLIHNEAARLATRLVRGYLALPYRVYVRLNSSELVRNAFDSVQVLTINVMKPAVEVVAETVLLIGMVTLLLWVAPQATLIVAAVLLPVVWVLLAFIQPRLKQLGRASQDSRGRSLRAMQEALGSFRDIRIFGHERVFADAFRSERRAMARAEYRRAALSEIPRASIETFIVVSIALVLILVVVTGQDDQEVMAGLGVLAYAGIRLQPALRQIVQGLNHVRFGAAVIDDLLEDRARVEAALADQSPVTAESPTRDFTQQIELRDVTFSYTEAEPVLRDVDLVIRKGEFVGVCGPTGAGKSTFIDLLVGLLSPTTGEVLVDGQPLGSDPGWWYARLGLVSQNIFLADDTIRKNIAFGERDEDIDDARLRRAVASAQLQDVIDELPEGLATVVGERGIRLSGGQRQRVAIARALYREPSVVVFDEGTSALDANTEAALVAAINELRGDRTLISVAHRISTIRNADRVVVLQAGAVVGEGSYDHLISENQLFRSLAR